MSLPGTEAHPNTDLLLNILKKLVLTKDARVIRKINYGYELLGDERMYIDYDYEFSLNVCDTIELTQHEAYVLEEWLKGQQRI